jgi:hypothetical protein
MPFDQAFGTTLIDSFPHLDGTELCPRLVEAIQIPAWPQLPRRTFRGNMYTQYSGGSFAWGIIPNDVEIFNVTPTWLAHCLQAGLHLIGDKARARGISIGTEEFAYRSLTPRLAAWDRRRSQLPKRPNRRWCRQARYSSEVRTGENQNIFGRRHD